jgi:hypothetical protein
MEADSGIVEAHFGAENSLQASVADLNQLDENPDPRKRKAGTGFGTLKFWISVHSDADPQH